MWFNHCSLQTSRRRWRPWLDIRGQRFPYGRVTSGWWYSNTRYRLYSHIFLPLGLLALASSHPGPAAPLPAASVWHCGAPAQSSAAAPWHSHPQSHLFLPSFTALLLLIQETTLPENAILESMAPFYLVFFFCVSVSCIAHCFTDVPPEIVAALGFCPWLSFSCHFFGVIWSVIKFNTACICVYDQICTFSSYFFFLMPRLAPRWVDPHLTAPHN